MFKIKNTGRAIGISAIIVCICFAMLLGTTFAWFTDNASTKVNTINTGSFDINILDANGATLVGDTLDFVTSNGTTMGSVLWEPGMTSRTETFTIKNEGNYALKFNIGDVFANATKRGAGDLMDVISYTVYVLEGNDYIKYLSYSKADGVKYGTLGEDLALYPTTNAQNLISSRMFYIEIKMDALSGNEYQECSLENLAVNVTAAQLGYEKDYAGTGYDTNAPYDTTATPAPGADELINP